VLTAIELNDQMSVGAKEIDNKAIDGELPSKFPSAKTAVAQAQPQHALCIRLIAA
jgi:hypothetical protein